MTLTLLRLIFSLVGNTYYRSLFSLVGTIFYLRGLLILLSYQCQRKALIPPSWRSTPGLPFFQNQKHNVANLDINQLEWKPTYTGATVLSWCFDLGKPSTGQRQGPTALDVYRRCRHDPGDQSNCCGNDNTAACGRTYVTGSDRSYGLRYWRQHHPSRPSDWCPNRKWRNQWTWRRRRKWTYHSMTRNGKFCSTDLTSFRRNEQRRKG
jgi:hypothetical protein